MSARRSLQNAINSLKYQLLRENMKNAMCIHRENILTMTNAMIDLESHPELYDQIWMTTSWAQCNSIIYGYLNRSLLINIRHEQLWLKEVPTIEELAIMFSKINV